MTTPVLDRLITRLVPVLEDEDERGVGDYPFSPTVPLVTPEAMYTRQKLWAARRDLRARDSLRVNEEYTADISSRVYIVRWSASWRSGDQLEGEDGMRCRVVGIAEMGRRQHTELLCEVTG